MKQLLLAAAMLLAVSACSPQSTYSPQEAQEKIRAAEGGDAEAQITLGRMYAVGNGVAQDFDKAAKLICSGVAQPSVHGFGYAELDLMFGGTGDAIGVDYFAELKQQEAALVSKNAPDGFRKVAELVQAAAKRGDLDAQMCLAKAYFWRNPALSASWFHKAAEQGNAEAQYQVGNMYDTGRGLPKDQPKAAAWYRKAAEQGVVDAQYNLALMYEGGLGTPQNFSEAVRWYRMAAEQGLFDAQGALGVMYIKGRGLPQDFVLAYAWSNLGASGPDESTPGSLWREEAARARDYASEQLSPAQLAEAQRLSSNWKKGQPITREKL